MPPASLEDQLLEDFERLAPDLQLRVRQFAHSLIARTPEGTLGEELAPFFGVIDAESAQEMEAAIQKHCEQIEPHAAW